MALKRVFRIDLVDTFSDGWDIIGEKALPIDGWPFSLVVAAGFRIGGYFLEAMSSPITVNTIISI